jgi:hypothetical protein
MHGACACPQLGRARLLLVRVHEALVGDAAVL